MAVATRTVVPRIVTERPAADRCAPNPTFTGRTDAERPVADRTVTCRPVADRTVTCRPVADRNLSGRPVAGRPVAGHPVAGRPGEGRTYGEGGRALSILVADDDYGHRRMLELVLSAHAFDVFGAQDGREALEHLTGATPDLMILDVDMPHASGFDVCDHVKGDDRLKVVPVVIMTGKAPEQVEARAERSRPDALVYKPIGAADLRSLIDGLMR